MEEYIKRTERKNPYPPPEWDYDREEKRNSLWGTPSSSHYRLPTGLAANLLSTLESINEKKQEIEAERQAIQKEVKQLKKTSPQSFMESVDAANTLSVHDLKRHGELQDKALKWLYNKGYIVASEVTLPNGKRADVVGYDETGHIIIIEVKVSIANFTQDKKWETYLEYCDEFYFVLNNDIQHAYYRAAYGQKGKRVGLLQETKNALKVRELHTLEHTASERGNIHFLVSKVLSKKFVYGY